MLERFFFFFFGDMYIFLLIKFLYKYIFYVDIFLKYLLHRKGGLTKNLQCIEWSSLEHKAVFLYFGILAKSLHCDWSLASPASQLLTSSHHSWSLSPWWPHHKPGDGDLGCCEGNVGGGNACCGFLIIDYDSVLIFSLLLSWFMVLVFLPTHHIKIPPNWAFK